MDGCEKTARARGWCTAHYNRWHRTGDPLKTRRSYTSTAECARNGCATPVKLYRGRPRKYCSLDCYRADASNRTITPRPCEHCSETYIPLGPNQRFCFTCLGPPIQTRHGTRYPGAARLRLYNVSHPEWLAMLAKFDGKCWICRTEPATALDHSHETSKARGALCDVCNTRLHYVENSGWLTAAQNYLAETSAVTF